MQVNGVQVNNYNPCGIVCIYTKTYALDFRNAVAHAVGSFQTVFESPATELYRTVRTPEE